LAQLSLHEEAEDCRRKALAYIGMPEGPFLLKLAQAFDELSAELSQRKAYGSTSYAGRQTDRVVVDAWLFMHRAGEVKFQTRIYDISPEGCLVEFVSRPRIGDRVWVKIEGLEALQATVCWVTGLRCGLNLAAPLNQAVFSSIVGNYQRRQGRGRQAASVSDGKAFG
jgi:hypothetical protein